MGYEAGQQIWHTALTANDAAQKEALGAIRFEGGNVYMYVQDSGSGVTAGHLVQILKGNKVASAAAGTAGLNYTKSYGVAMAALTASYYGWVQLRGLATVAKSIKQDAAESNNPVAIGSTAGLITMTATNDIVVPGLWVATTATTAQTTVECTVAFL